MLTVQQVADRYQVSTDTVRAWIHAGDLDAIDVSNGKVPQYRVAEPWLEKFEHGRKRRKPAKPVKVAAGRKNFLE